MRWTNFCFRYREILVSWQANSSPAHFPSEKVRSRRQKKHRDAWPLTPTRHNKARDPNNGTSRRVAWPRLWDHNQRPWPRPAASWTRLANQRPLITIRALTTTTISNHHSTNMGDGHFKCVFEGCNKTFKTRGGAYKHHSIIHGSRRIQCTYCNAVYRNGDDVKRHLKKAHNAVLLDIRQPCGVSVTTETDKQASPTGSCYIRSPITQLPQKHISKYYHHHPPTLLINLDDGIPFKKARTDNQGTPLADFEYLRGHHTRVLRRVIRRLENPYEPKCVRDRKTLSQE